MRKTVVASTRIEAPRSKSARDQQRNLRQALHPVDETRGFERIGLCHGSAVRDVHQNQAAHVFLLRPGGRTSGTRASAYSSGCPLKPITTSCAIFSRSVIVLIQRAAMAWSDEPAGISRRAAGFSDRRVSATAETPEKLRCTAASQQRTALTSAASAGAEPPARRRRPAKAAFRARPRGQLPDGAQQFGHFLVALANQFVRSRRLLGQPQAADEARQQNRARRRIGLRESAGSIPRRRFRSSAGPSPRCRNDVFERFPKLPRRSAPSRLHNHDPPESSCGR